MVLGPLEHEVFKEVGETGSAGLLVLRPDVIPDIHGDDRDVMVFVDDDVETVGERAFGEGKRERVHPSILPLPATPS